MYSQNNEEQHILRYFAGHEGRFLDIGAYDGKTFSNTWALTLREWGGVLVEPGKKAFSDLMVNYCSVPNKTYINAAVGDTDGRAILAEGISGEDNAGALSALVESGQDHLEKWNHVDFSKTEVEVITYNTLFDRHGTDYDFINIDAEGMSWHLLRSLPFDRLPKLKCICVEHDNLFTDIIQHGLIHGFDHYVCTSENVIMTKGNTA